MVPVTFGGPATESFIVYSAILGVKVLVMGPLTGYYRKTKKVFASEEDAKAFNGVVKSDDPDVERVRRAHLNDLENIPVFWTLGALYLTTDPDPEVAKWLFRVYTAGRVLHTLVYAVKSIPRVRGPAYGVSSLIAWYMGVKVISHYIKAL